VPAAIGGIGLRCSDAGPPPARICAPLSSVLGSIPKYQLISAMTMMVPMPSPAGRAAHFLRDRPPHYRSAENHPCASVYSPGLPPRVPIDRVSSRSDVTLIEVQLTKCFPAFIA
jgi:hypothetical protein